MRARHGQAQILDARAQSARSSVGRPRRRASDPRLAIGKAHRADGLEEQRRGPDHWRPARWVRRRASSCAVRLSHWPGRKPSPPRNATRTRRGAGSAARRSADRPAPPARRRRAAPALAMRPVRCATTGMIQHRRRHRRLAQLGQPKAQQPAPPPAPARQCQRDAEQPRPPSARRQRRPAQRQRGGSTGSAK